jgi:hypothetical protein
MVVSDVSASCLWSARPACNGLFQKRRVIPSQLAPTAGLFAFAGASLRRPLTAFHIHIDGLPLKTDMTHMANETEDPIIRLLREIRAAQEATNARLDETNAKLDGFITSTDKKLDKLNIELIGVKGRVRKVEEAIESIARVMSDGALG